MKQRARFVQIGVFCTVGELLKSKRKLPTRAICIGSLGEKTLIQGAVLPSLCESLKPGGNLGSLFSSQRADIWHVIMGSFTSLTILGIRSLFYLFVDPTNQPSAIRNREIIVLSPGHSEVITQQKEGFQHHWNAVFRI